MPPLRHVHRAYDYADPAAGPHHTEEFPQRQVGVALLQHRDGKGTTEAGVGERQSFRVGLPEVDRSDHAFF